MFLAFDFIDDYFHKIVPMSDSNLVLCKILDTDDGSIEEISLEALLDIYNADIEVLNLKFSTFEIPLSDGTSSVSISVGSGHASARLDLQETSKTSILSDILNETYVEINDYDEGLFEGNPICIYDINDKTIVESEKPKNCLGFRQLSIETFKTVEFAIKRIYGIDFMNTVDCLEHFSLLSKNYCYMITSDRLLKLYKLAKGSYYEKNITSIIVTVDAKDKTDISIILGGSLYESAITMIVFDDSINSYKDNKDNGVVYNKIYEVQL